jgi:ADP-ribosylation factor-like protein 5B
MGLLLTKLYRIFFSSEEFKVVIVGLDNAGKTTILYRL